MTAFISSFTTPGAFVTEQVAGVIPASISAHTAVYVLGHSTRAGIIRDVPTFCSSFEDFNNQFSPVTPLTANAVQLFFNQRPGTGIYFIAVSPKSSRTITVPTATVGATYTLTVDGFLLSYVAVTGDTATTIRDRLGALVNAQMSYIAQYTGGASGTIRYTAGTTITASANVTLGTETVAGAAPTVADVVATLSRPAFTSELPQGFLLAPEFYANASAVDHAALANSLDTFCADPRFAWVNLVDCRQATATATTNGGAVNQARTEESALASPRGHSWYYFPYVRDLSDNLVPPSAAVAGIACRRFRNDGFFEPVAGVRYPVSGVRSLSFDVDDLTQGQLNPVGINAVRRLPGKGIVIYGARTVSSDPFYRFGNTRVIMNVLTGSLRNAFDSMIFSAVDGLGAVFGRIKGTSVAICELLRQAGALYGSTPDQAYRVICDATNNPGLNLENGVVTADIYVRPAPTLEVLVLRLTRTSLASTFDEVIPVGSSPSQL